MERRRVRWVLGGLVSAGVVAGGMLLSEVARTGPSRAVASVVGGRLRVSGAHGSIELRTQRPVGAAAIGDDGQEVAITTGTPLEHAAGGVRGQVSVVESSTGQTLARTGFDRAILTDVTLSPDGARVAFVKDYEELWVMNAAGEKLRKVADGRALAPLGGTVFDPAFTADGTSIYFGVVEQTFLGEDDKLDNIWKSSWEGELRRVTSFSSPGGTNAWRVVRGPLPLPRGRVMFTTGRSDRELWSAKVVDRDGDVSRLGPVPAMTQAIGVGPGQIVFQTLNHHNMSADLYSMAVHGVAARWSRWCAAGCRVIDRGLDAGAVASRADAHP